jgi:tetratricopeptide (TPR) repeat protein
MGAARGLRAGPLKYLHSRHDRLFDREKDPGEKTNLFVADEASSRGLQKRLEWMQANPGASLVPKGIQLDPSMQQALQATGYIQASILDLEKRPDFSKLDDIEDHLDLVFELEEINQFFAEGRPERSIGLLRKACVDFKNSAMLHEQLAALLLTLNQPEVLDEAENHLHAALGIDSHRSRSHFDLGLVHMRRMKLARRTPAEVEQRRAAIAQFRLALEVDQNSPQALANLATMLRMEAETLLAPQPASEAARDEAARLMTEAVALLDRFLTVLPVDHADRPKMQTARDQYRALLDSLRPPK